MSTLLKARAQDGEEFFEQDQLEEAKQWLHEKWEEAPDTAYAYDFSVYKCKAGHVTEIYSYDPEDFLSQEARSSKRYVDNLIEEGFVDEDRRMSLLKYLDSAGIMIVEKENKSLPRKKKTKA